MCTQAFVMALVFNSTSKAWALSSTPANTLPEERPAVHNELFSVPNTTDTLHITKLSTFANETATPPLNWLFYTGTYGVSPALLTRMFDICNATLYGFQIPHGVAWALAFEPLRTVFVSHGAGSNALGQSPSDGNSMILLVSPLWVNSASNGLVHAKATELVAKLDAAAKEMGVLKRFVYGKYADWSQKPLQSYGETNMELFRQTARKYDPMRVFQNKVPGGFKLFG